MKKHIRYIPVMLAVAVLLGSCTNMLAPPEVREAVPAGKGRVTIQLGDNARTALPGDLSFDKYVLRFAYAGTEIYTHGDEEWSDGVSVDLEPGEWTVYADAYFDGVVSGTGSAVVTVNSGVDSTVKIPIGPKTGDTNIKGTLKYKVTYPDADDMDHAYGDHLLYVLDIEGNSAGVPNTPVTITSGVEETLPLPVGVYIIRVLITDTVQRTSASDVKVAHIYGGQETPLNFTLTAAQFTATVPVTVTAELINPSEIPVENRWVELYKNASCADILGRADLSEDGEITLWAPSSSTSVYIRQEVTIGGVTLNGHLETVTLAGVGTSGSLEDTLYKITVSNDTRHGTVQSNLPAAFPGTDITITAVKDPDAFFVDGTLRVLSDTPVTVSGSGANGNFAMPDEDVELSAEFHQFVRYGKAGGDGYGESWDDASDDVQMLMDELAALSVEHVAHYTGPYIVKLGAGTYLPKYEPMIPGPGTPYTYTPGSRDNAFILREGVQVWGGYPTDGGEDSSRNITDNSTTLSGDFDDNDSDTGNPTRYDANAYHVVLTADANSDTILNGLTISGGNARGGSGDLVVGSGINIPRNSGGGIYSHNASPALKQVRITNNYADYGGGMYNDGSSSPDLIDVEISENHAIYQGGGMYNGNGSSPDLARVKISYNNVVLPSGSGGGGGIYNSGSSPTLTDVEICNNDVTGGISSGGGIYNDNSNLTLNNNVNIHDNSADTDGGGIYNDNSNLALNNNVNIHNNGAMSNGGGVYVASGTFAMSDTAAISENYADTYGGGVYVASGTFAMSDTAAISENYADTYGGGVYVAGGTFAMDGGTISGNEATVDGGGVYVASGTFAMSGTAAISDNEVGSNGGGVYFAGTEFTMIAGTISGNTAPTGGDGSGKGGGVYVGSGKFTMEGGTIGGDTSKANIAEVGGGVYFAGTEFTMEEGTIGGNNARNAGGGVYVAGGTFTMNEDAATISNNTAATGSGGGVFVEGGEFKMEGGTISGNTATASGGGSGGGVSVGLGGTFAMSGGTISGNTATGDGGGVYVEEYLGYCGTFTKTAAAGIIYGYDALDDQKNTASGIGHGHAVYVADGPKKRDATAGTGDGLDSATSGPSGGWDATFAYIKNAIEGAASGSTVTLSAGTYFMESQIEIKDNKTITITTAGGVILKRKSDFTTDNMIKVTSGGLILQAAGTGSLTLDGNSEEVTASGSLVRVESGNLTIGNGVTLRNNDITGNGGGVYFAGSGTFEMNGGTISNNTATVRGGGVYVGGGTFTMPTGSTAAIKGNTATVEGGGVYVDYGAFTMNNGTIGGSDSADANTAVRGGGVYTLGGAAFAMSGNATVSGNTATGSNSNGGGVYLDGSFDMTGGTISSNSAGTFGGGVYVAMSGTFTMSSGTINGGNEATDGGGVYVKDNGSSFTMSGSAAVSNNIATGNGGGVYVGTGGTFTMSGGIVDGTGKDINATSGGGVYVAGGTFTMSETAIVRKNTAASEGGGVYVFSGSFTKSGGTIYGNMEEDGLTPEDTALKNTATGGGHAVYVYDASTSKKRDSTAGLTVSLDSNTGTNWE